MIYLPIPNLYFYLSYEAIYFDYVKAEYKFMITDMNTYPSLSLTLDETRALKMVDGYHTSEIIDMPFKKIISIGDGEERDYKYFLDYLYMMNLLFYLANKVIYLKEEVIYYFLIQGPRVTAFQLKSLHQVNKELRIFTKEQWHQIPTKKFNYLNHYIYFLISNKKLVIL